MAIYVSRRNHLQPPKALFSLFKSSIITTFFLLSCANSLSFNFSEFGSSTDIIYQGDAAAAKGFIQLTPNQVDIPINGSVGRAIYAQPVRLWDSTTGSLTDFTTNFSFYINALDDSSFGYGLAFFLAPNGSDIPPNSAGGSLGLFSADSNNNQSLDQIVAVQIGNSGVDFDPFQSSVGINDNSFKVSIKDGSTGNTWVSYNANTQNLSVFITSFANPNSVQQFRLSKFVDLKTLPEWINVGFSATTGQWVEMHNINSWNFSSSLEIGEEDSGKKGNNLTGPGDSGNESNSEIGGGGNNVTGQGDSRKKGNNEIGKGDSGKKGKKIGLVVGLIAASVLICLVGLVWFGLWRKVGAGRKEEDEKGTGPKRFTYRELALATNNFREDGKLGQGGFGGVYKGFLSESKTNVAVKKFSEGSSHQGEKEYNSEVNTISQLSHRNLVQLIGYCDERREFLLVYEFMPNGSLHSHLFGRKSLLTWVNRYKIARGLASALLYLHEECKQLQCVLHRDIKSSNVMLDSDFNAKLGDFGLARLVDHGRSTQTTDVAGTQDYLAPECFTTSKFSKESDVYSFGVVALEIACGRKPIQRQAEEDKVRLVDWVWKLYGREKLIDAADSRLNMDFDETQMKCLMVVGLWCANPDYNLRPTIKEVIKVLHFEAPLPSLPSQMPQITYFTPPASSSVSSSAALLKNS